jgi:purine-binding chemotaxis protein CheW
VVQDLLVLRAEARWLAIPAARVAEILRPLPCEPMPGAPPFVLGAVLLRGVATPVIDAGALLGLGPLEDATRLVSLRLEDGRRVALAVSEVKGLASADALGLAEPQPMLVGDETVALIGRLDGQLLSVLSLARVIAPDAAIAAGDAR